MKRGFYHVSKAWYADSALKGREYTDEVIFGLYCDQGGTTGEMGVRWGDLENKNTPKLHCFDDAWAVLAGFKDVIDEMGKVDDQNIKPEEFCVILLKCGFEDLTPVKQP